MVRHSLPHPPHPHTLGGGSRDPRSTPVGGPPPPRRPRPGGGGHRSRWRGSCGLLAQPAKPPHVLTRFSPPPPRGPMLAPAWRGPLHPCHAGAPQSPCGEAVPYVHRRCTRKPKPRPLGAGSAPGGVSRASGLNAPPGPAYAEDGCSLFTAFTSSCRVSWIPIIVATCPSKALWSS